MGRVRFEKWATHRGFELKVQIDGKVAHYLGGGVLCLDHPQTVPSFSQKGPGRAVRRPPPGEASLWIQSLG